ncbi:hypothetical protein [Ruminiclostridium papyrosolvens]|uniref:Uncharacterized protein n=1 Tax=Ruminiclostridium papyrosolvens C7 TaxID=1330534 RepID=U4QWP9_9FIRM|nr:hypothetical protein [Ruminiclostridium papyrosolvens]EPR07754.1 hypothetical protein L323_19835 [Ruminiclostridium papyrosolvens C7]
MAKFESFGEYMFSLLFTPLRKGLKAANQFYIFFKVIGKLFDDCKEYLFRVRDESMIISANELMLNEHGKDRGMPRLKGEDIETYRTRLSMKAIIAEKAGTKEGVLLAVKALGYEKSYIEPMYLSDPSRWAEFIVFLQSKTPSTINDLYVIDAEVMKVKEASAKPNYGLSTEGSISLSCRFDFFLYEFPICNVLICGGDY